MNSHNQVSLSLCVCGGGGVGVCGCHSLKTKQNKVKTKIVKTCLLQLISPPLKFYLETIAKIVTYVVSLE